MREMDLASRRKVVADYMCRLAGTEHLEDSVDVFSTGMVNSLAAIQLITFLEKNFKIKVNLDDLDKGNFSSIQAICNFLGRKAASDA
jgi:acyl carrier protein